MDRFDLESKIMNVWNTKEDLELLIDSLSTNSDVGIEEIVDILIGVSKLHDLRCKSLWDTFEGLIESRKII